MTEKKSEQELATELVIKCIDKSVIASNEDAVETAWKRFYKMIHHCYKGISEEDQTN